MSGLAGGIQGCEQWVDTAGWRSFLRTYHFFPSFPQCSLRFCATVLGSWFPFCCQWPEREGHIDLGEFGSSWVSMQGAHKSPAVRSKIVPWVTLKKSSQECQRREFHMPAHVFMFLRCNRSRKEKNSAFEPSASLRSNQLPTVRLSGAVFNSLSKKPAKYWKVKSKSMCISTVHHPTQR